MNGFKKSLRILLPVLAAMQLAACSRTVQWEEEVPLNTGETIWVKRIATFTYKGDAGNPLDMAMRPDWKETLAFTYKGKAYQYTGEAHLLVLAVSPQHKPVLVAPASDKSWDWQNNYRCTVPHYVQLTPDADGTTWTWPEHIEPWLYGLPANLLIKRERTVIGDGRVTAAGRNEADKTLRIQSSIHQKIEPSFSFTGCKRKD